MKRWRYLCAAALIAGSMAAEAGAVSIPSTALTQLLQQWQADTSADSGQSRIAAYALVPEKICTKFLPTACTVLPWRTTFISARLFPCVSITVRKRAVLHGMVVDEKCQ